MTAQAFSRVVLGVVCFATVCAAQEGTRTMRYVAGNAEATTQWQEKLRAALFEKLGMTDWVAGKDVPPLAAEEIRKEQRDGYLFAEYRLRATSGRTLVVSLARPEGRSGKLPAVVALHGHSGSHLTPFNREEKIYKEFGGALARQGFVVAAPDVGQHQPFEAGRLLMAERLWDGMRCVDFLRSLPEVDPARIGCAGLSLGGEMAMWLGAMDTRIAATASCGFLTTMDHMEVKHCMCWKFDGLRALADWSDIYGLTAPRPLQCQNGLKEPPDQFQVPLARQAFAEVVPVYRAFGKEQNATLHVHSGAHEIDLEALLKFMREYLHAGQ